MSWDPIACCTPDEGKTKEKWTLWQDAGPSGCVSTHQSDSQSILDQSPCVSCASWSQKEQGILKRGEKVLSRSPMSWTLSNSGCQLLGPEPIPLSIWSESVTFLFCQWNIGRAPSTNMVRQGIIQVLPGLPTLTNTGSITMGSVTMFPIQFPVTVRILFKCLRV
jgi:hypothetical protein